MNARLQGFHRVLGFGCVVTSRCYCCVASLNHSYDIIFVIFACICPGFQPPSVDAVGGDVVEGSPELARVVRGDTPGEFNLYIFAMSWKAEW